MKKKTVQIFIILIASGLSFFSYSDTMNDYRTLGLNNLTKSCLATTESYMLPEVRVLFWGFPDVQVCSYWENTISGEINFSVMNPGITLGGTWTNKTGTRTICDNSTDDRCDYIGCH